jgi:Polyketide cyclase / dehydrase and lipid transport.
MTSIYVTQRLAYPAETVWALIGDFGGLHRWHPQVQRLDLSWEGRIRTLHYADGNRVVERLEARNDSAHRYGYVLVDGSLPMLACRSRLEAQADGTHCQVTWSSEFEPLGNAERKAEAALRAIYGAGLEVLAAALGQL